LVICEWRLAMSRANPPISHHGGRPGSKSDL
jgi:hypothetical protein